VGAEIIVIGELNVDLVASGLHSEPKLGKEILAADFRIALGSASAIFACGAARLGHAITFISKVGVDDFGRFCLNALQQVDISTANVLQSQESTTGVTIVLSTREDRALVTCLGAIAELRYSEIQAPLFQGHRHLHLTSYFLQHALRPDFLAIIRQAKQNGLTVSFDPNSDPSQAWGNDIWRIFAEVDIVFLNEVEALAITQRAKLPDAVNILEKATVCLVVKLGSKGAIGAQNGEKILVPGFKVQAIDTTGAGDTFAAGFVHGRLLGRGMAECLLLGNAAGALSTRGPGGTAGQVDQATLDKFVRENVPADLQSFATQWPSLESEPEP
jgi:sugar/nucleoside kinase (ribokinase family)